MKVIACVLLFTVSVFGCDSDPDHTNERLHWRNCKTDTPMYVNNVQFFNDDGSPNYPISVHKPLNVVLNLTNTANHAWDNIIASAEVSMYTDIFGFCSWLNIPTLGLLDDIEICKPGIGNEPCPQQPGLVVIRGTLDITPFQLILDFLIENDPYRFHVTYRSGGTELYCLEIEAKITHG